MRAKLDELGDAFCASMRAGHLPHGINRYELHEAKVCSAPAGDESWVCMNSFIFHKTETFVFWHMTEISARKWGENDCTDVPHLFVSVKIIRNSTNHVLIRIYGWQFGRKMVKVGGWPKKSKFWQFSEWACLQWKILVDVRRVFLAYLEGPNSMLVTNTKHE